jgi:hypothetical protein
MVSDEDYYESKKQEFFSQFKEFCENVGVLIGDKYGEKFKKEVMVEIKEQFESIYESLPYIGGDENSLTMDLFGAAESLAFFLVLKRHGKPLQEIGEMAYKAQGKSFEDHPEAVPPMNNPEFFPYMKYAAENSQKRRFPGDWVYEFVEGNEEFDMGMDFTECGIQKLFHKYDADEFTPYLCAMDILMSECGNLGLHRSQTLTEGGNHCDFRYKGGRKTKIANSVIKKG